MKSGMTIGFAPRPVAITIISDGDQIGDGMISWLMATDNIVLLLHCSGDVQRSAALQAFRYAIVYRLSCALVGPECRDRRPAAVWAEPELSPFFAGTKNQRECDQRLMIDSRNDTDLNILQRDEEGGRWSRLSELGGLGHCLDDVLRLWLSQRPITEPTCSETQPPHVP